MIGRGTQWGEEGFIRIKRNDQSRSQSSSLPLLSYFFFPSHTGVCGMALSASLPIGGFLLSPSSSSSSSEVKPGSRSGSGGDNSRFLFATLSDWFLSNEAVRICYYSLYRGCWLSIDILPCSFSLHTTTLLCTAVIAFCYTSLLLRAILSFCRSLFLLHVLLFLFIIEYCSFSFWNIALACEFFIHCSSSTRSLPVATAKRASATARSHPLFFLSLLLCPPPGRSVAIIVLVVSRGDGGRREEERLWR